MMSVQPEEARHAHKASELNFILLSAVCSPATSSLPKAVCMAVVPSSGRYPVHTHLTYCTDMHVEFRGLMYVCALYNKILLLLGAGERK